MSGFSRRQLADYAVNEIVAKHPVADLSAHLAAALVNNGWQKEVELLLLDIDQELEERGLLARVRLISTYVLSEKLKTELASKLKKMAGVKEVILLEEIDKTVIGGIKIETATRSWDRTIIRTLTQLKERT